MVQEQWLQLKMKFSLSYFMKMSISGRNEPLAVGGIWWEENPPSPSSKNPDPIMVHNNAIT